MGLVTESFNSSETNLGNLTLSDPLTINGSSTGSEGDVNTFFLAGKQRNGAEAFGYYVTYKVVSSGGVLDTRIKDNEYRLTYLHLT